MSNPEMSKQLSSFCADWISLFPQLHRYKGGRKLLLWSGSVVYGIELRKISDDVYRPEFICLNLLSGFNEFSLRREFTISKNLQADIEYRHHARDFRLVAEVIQNRVPLLVSQTPQALEIVKLYQTHIDLDMARGVSPVGLMTALIQHSIYFGLPDVEATERQNLARHYDALPVAVRDSLGHVIEKEISQTSDHLRENMELNLAKSGWGNLT